MNDVEVFRRDYDRLRDSFDDLRRNLQAMTWPPEKALTCSHNTHARKGGREMSTEKHSYLIHLIDTETNRWGRCVFQSECPHGMQEWADYLASRGDLHVHDENGEKFQMHHPRVVHVDPHAAEHIPIVDPV